jgi:MFS family permease
VALALLGILIILFAVPSPVTSRFHRDTEVEWAWLGKVLADPQLLRLDAGVLILHFVMTATMFTLPLVLLNQHDFELKHHWWIWVPVLFLSALPVLPLIILGEKKRLLKQAVVGAVAALFAASLLVWQANADWWVLLFALWLFFVGFNLLEASLPSLVAKFAPPAHRGTAMGAYSSMQFMGAFLGAMTAGLVAQHFGEGMVFLANGLLVLLWLLLVFSMRQPPYLSSRMLQVGEIDDRQAQQLVMQLTAVRGVAEAVVIPEDGIAYLKVDNRALDNEALSAFSAH